MAEDGTEADRARNRRLAFKRISASTRETATTPESPILYRLGKRCHLGLLPEPSDEVFTLVNQAVDADSQLPIPGRRAWVGARTRRRGTDGTWAGGSPADAFALLEAVGAPGLPCPFLQPDLDAIGMHRGP